MQVDVIVMAEKSTQSIMDWQLRPDRKGELRAIFRDGVTQSSERAWKDLALTINRRAFAAKHIPVEIFLYLREGLKNSISEHGLLEDIVAQAMDHGWGAKLYVVWERFSKRMFKTTFSEKPNQIHLAKCFCAFLRAGVTDLIELTRNEKSQREFSFEEEKKELRDYAVNSEKRLKSLKAIVTKGGWSYVSRKDALPLNDFLNEFIEEGCLPASGSKHLIIFDSPPEYGPKELLDKFKSINPDKQGIVVTTPEGESKPLQYHCETEEPPLKLLSFNGIFEATYALLQLNKAEAFEVRQENSSYNAEVKIETVKLIERPIFRSSAVASAPRLLITSAFHPKEEPHHSITAAWEVGAIINNLPFNLDIEVHPCITCESLPDLIESKQFTAWIHLSHGEEQKGLYEPQLEEYASPERWLACFTAYKSSLRLALFSSCESASVARLFAKAGVDIAVGFKDVVLIEATRILVKKVVPIAMQDGSNQEAILKAFRDACDSLKARTFSDGSNDMSYIDARPIAFRVAGK